MNADLSGDTVRCIRAAPPARIPQYAYCAVACGRCVLTSLCFDVALQFSEYSHVLLTERRDNEGLHYLQ